VVERVHGGDRYRLGWKLYQLGQVAFDHFCTASSVGRFPCFSPRIKCTLTSSGSHRAQPHEPSSFFFEVRSPSPA
jgi:hypothetical protein